MARTVTLLQLRTDARLYADERPGGSTAFITDAELTRMVNQELCALYDQLVAARGSLWYVKRVAGGFPTVAGTSTYALPTDFYEFYSLTLLWGTRNYEQVPRVSARDGTALYNGATWGQWSPKAYTLGGQAAFVITPTPTSVVTCDLLYIPTCTALSGDSDTFDGVNGWDDAVSLGVAVKIRALQDAPTADLIALRDDARQRIADLAGDQDAQMPAYVQDVAPEQTWASPWGRLPRP